MHAVSKIPRFDHMSFDVLGQEGAYKNMRVFFCLLKNVRNKKTAAISEKSPAIQSLTYCDSKIKAGGEAQEEELGQKQERKKNCLHMKNMHSAANNTAGIGPCFCASNQVYIYLHLTSNEPSPALRACSVGHLWLGKKNTCTKKLRLFGSPKNPTFFATHHAVSPRVAASRAGHSTTNIAKRTDLAGSPVIPTGCFTVSMQTRKSKNPLCWGW